MPVLTDSRCKQKFGNTIDSALHLCSGEKNANKDTCQVKKKLSL